MAEQRLSDELLLLAEEFEGKQLTFGELTQRLSGRTQALVTLVLSLPFILPVPLPGVSIPFGLFILFNGFRITTNRKIWLPRILRKRRISGLRLALLFRRGAKLFKRLEKVTKPRGAFLTKHPSFEKVNGAVLALAGFFLALPLPPGTNFPPGVTALLISIGILEGDGLFVVLGYIAFVLCLLFFTFLPIILQWSASFIG